ncbi:signal peptidase I [Haloferax sp. Atlit-6N]|uniref:Peptidase S26 domain protein n=2 Tax=Haloferax TaxID=2251 RepID=A0A871BLP9_HALGI|nr:MULTISPECIES: signal peptidase I [Haloferax]ELZ63490.1 peptidase S26B, signal peptidase [Haloferax prahovense DSM 18310]QOS13685.1 peptidase S26 domain protein [Haloferax gibbonsii]RDZ51158.1 signal peptidase I [Haloferax sp. Atlit-4N]REA02801.1 signal peptidase I [Haloferax sp. Atlit-6N]
MHWSRLAAAARVLGGVVLLVAVALVVVLAAPQVFGAEASYTVLSGSMSPTFDAGDVVVVRDVPPTDISEGDIITYREAGSAITDERTDRVTHRVVAVDRSGDSPVFRTKGDANEDVDSDPVAADRVVGSVWFHVPYLGLASQFAQSKLGLVLFVILPGALLVVTELYSLYTDALVEVDGDEEDGPGGSAESAGSDGRPNGGAGIDAGYVSASDGGVTLYPERTGVRLSDPVAVVESPPSSSASDTSASTDDIEWVTDPADRDAAATAADETPASEDGR